MKPSSAQFLSILSLLSSLASAETIRRPTVEFAVDGSVLQAFGGTVSERAQRVEQGATISPVVDVAVSAQVGNASNLAAINVSMVPNGQVVAQKTISTRRRQITANATLPIAGSASKAIYVGPQGISAGDLNLNFDISRDIRIQDSGGVFPGLVQRIGTRVADEKIDEVLPQALGKIKGQIEKAASEILVRANGQLGDAANRLLAASELKQLPFQLSLSSTSAGRGGINAALFDDKNPKTENRPSLVLSDRNAGQIYIHESAVNKAIAEVLKNKKELPLSVAMQKICENPLLRRLPFCEKDLDGIFANAVIRFDAEDPVRVSFQAGEMKLVINAVHDLNVKTKEEETPSFRGTPYQVEVTYGLERDRMRRKSIRLNERLEEPKRAAFDFLPTGEASGTNHDILPPGAINRAIRYLADPVEKKALEAAYAKAFKEEVAYPTPSIPARFSVYNPSQGAVTPTISQKVRFFATDTKSENGWFASSISWEPHNP